MKKDHQRTICDRLIVMVLGITACESEPTGSMSLVEVDQWQRVTESQDDIFGSERPEDAVCDELRGVVLEPLGDELVLEVATDYCNYVTLRQSSLVALVPGDTVKIQFWHSPLVAPMASEAYLGLAIDSEVMWETQVPIPAEAAFVTDEFIVERELPLGAELRIHIHNHGGNTYDLLGIEATLRGER